MSKIDDIKSGLECWDNHFPLNPPETKAEEILREEIKRRAQLFHAQGIENVRYLLECIDRYEKALMEISGYNGKYPDGYNCGVIAKEALKE